ncbi:hypothetical protein CNEO4_1730016 [Clostridium neonatale]|uniref:Uncharacterized protein n=1 Tax=Clostridium neonatale TaxID=137838 RepID=A0AAD2DD61_9CLOT|nr:hypothetical protein CNEO2_270036 [Clostridium neonatale]CAI3200525.1 hypothetical protein CNEO2_260051 [Clostridium neonatale]CAI3203033.1 hypothetical protein CNEO2_220044 [Clostridium neonatale]CAI3203429.1 hypothetical protein CNEO2_290053 [Clostridium neonatale]CAI3205660.1 hypothetical protein CNEO2_300036 [Clostridium neonatale]
MRISSKCRKYEDLKKTNLNVDLIYWKLIKKNIKNILTLTIWN